MDFSVFGRERTEAGQRELAHAMRILVKRQAPEVAAALDEVADEVFLEPLLFTYFAVPEPDVELPQILFGALPPELRPDAIDIAVDKEGRAFLPGIGTFFTEEAGQRLELFWDRTFDRYELWQGSRRIPVRFEPPVYVPGTSIELVRYVDPLTLTRFFDTERAPARGVRIDGRGELHIGNIVRAFATLSEVDPAYYREILQVTRRIVRFRHDDVNSFATVNAHGTAFFNAKDEHDEVFFVDELAHQCGHVVFNAMTVLRRDFLAVDPDGPLAPLVGRADERRHVYDIFHGVYTEHKMATTMRSAEERHLYRGKQAHELWGRLSFIARRYNFDLSDLSHDGIFTPLGRDFYGCLVHDFRELYSARGDLFEGHLGPQPYNFDYDVFARSNPMTANGARQRELNE